METRGCFKSFRGVRQGDPLCLLFILAQELLERSLNSLLSSSSFIPYLVPKRCPLISHLSFADDTIVFSTVSRRSLRYFAWVLDEFRPASGQQINRDKSSFTLSSKALEWRKTMIHRLLGFLIGMCLLHIWVANSKVRKGVSTFSHW
jgi:hypothetical protein